jgi:adenylate cyclase
MFSLSLFASLLVVLWASAWQAFVAGGLLIDVGNPSLALSATYVFSSIVRHLSSERRQRWVRQAFSRYVSPNLVTYLVKHPEALELGGRRQQCSFVFTDLAGFTTLMESMDPGDAVELINGYLERMIAIAFSHEGTLSRIAGDAVVIMFSAPVPQLDHQRRALACALDMQRFAQKYANELQARGIAFGQTRIGIHTGEVIVGNFGGSTIFDYRALGDPVNTASRLEGANKYLGTLTCVSAATLSGCPDWLARPVGRIILKGKAQPLAVFEPLDPLTVSGPDADYQHAFELMRAELPEATSMFEKLAAQRPADPLVALHLARLRSGKTGDLIIMSEK